MNAQATTMTMDEQQIALTELCQLQARVDELKAKLGDFLTPGETMGCSAGKLTHTKEVETTTYTAEGKRQKEAFTLTLIEKELAKKVVGPSQLRLTLAKS